MKLPKPVGEMGSLDIGNRRFYADEREYEALMAIDAYTPLFTAEQVATLLAEAVESVCIDKEYGTDRGDGYAEEISFIDSAAARLIVSAFRAAYCKATT